jgi:hypothetical protein
MEPGTNFVALLADGRTLAERMGACSAMIATKWPDSERDCGRDSLSCPGRLQPVQTLRRHPTGDPPPVRAQHPVPRKLGRMSSFDSNLSETSGISDKSYGL